LAEADKMILNKLSVQLDDHDKIFASTPNWSKLVENMVWLNAQQHVRHTEWCAVLGDKNDTDFVLPNKLSIPKTSILDSGKIDEDIKTYVEMVQEH